jgi:WD40 repeat protein
MGTSDLTRTAGSLDAMAHEPSDKLSPSTEASTAAWQTGLPTNSGATRSADPPTVDEQTTHAGSLSIPGHEILGELGRGGMGVVYKARQTHLNRVVAVKVVLAGGHASADELARFRAEAEAVARMQHPNIVQIFETGQQDGLPYFTLEYVDGGSLAHKLDGTPLPPAEAAELVETLARAVHYAHTNGVVHRDLKPANVLLAQDGTPKITDFGLAKKVEGGGVTRSGAIMGTPSYMAPEQAGGQTKQIGPATDLYALGAILYECLTGRPPFKAATDLDTILQVISDDPVPPTQLQSKTPRDLETICLKCLRKEPEKRYATAHGLADDLQRFLNNEPITARPVGRVERGLKWVRRQPALAAMIAATVVITAISFVVVLLLLADAIRSRDDTVAALGEREKALGERDKALTQAGEREREKDHQLANSNVLLAQAAWDSNNVVVARERLAEVPPQWRGWEWYYLKRQYEGGPFTLKGHSGGVTSVAFSADGLRLATASRDQTARVWNAQSGEMLQEFKGHRGVVTGVAFSPDGLRLATASHDQTARVWNARSGEMLQEFKGHAGEVTSVAFSPGGLRLATGSRDQTARVWDARSGEKLVECEGHLDSVTSVAFSPDGLRLATASQDQPASVWDARTGEKLIECKGRTSPGTSVAFSPDGLRLATGSWDQTARVWDARTGEKLVECKGHAHFVWSVAFSHDGLRLATASMDQTARVWDARTGEKLLECKGHASSVLGVAFSPDDLRLATASMDQTARVWDARMGDKVLECQGHKGRVTSVAFSSDGLRLATGSEDRTARVWDARTGEKLVECQGHTGQVTSVAFSPDGLRLATGSIDQTARAWDARTGERLLACQGHTGEVTSVAFSADGLRLATGSGDQTARVWDARTGKKLLECKGHTNWVHSVAFSSDGLRLATGSYDKTARVWDARTGEKLLECKGHTNVVYSVAFSPDGLRLATGSSDNTARIWDARAGTKPVECRGHSLDVTSVAFSPDGLRLATGGGDETARVWDAQSGQPLLECKGHRGAVRSVAFNADGLCLATASDDGTVRVWDGRALSEAEAVEWRRWATQIEPAWHEQQFLKNLEKDLFAAAFHLDRMLAYLPPKRTELLRDRNGLLWATLKQNKDDAPARLLLARTAWHSPELGPKDATDLLPAADDKRPFAQRTRGGLLLRQKKAAEAVPVLEAALKERGDDPPPVEELLLAWAYLDTNQADKARALWAKAMAWLDGGQEAVRAADLAGTLPAGALPGVAPLFVLPTHPRYSAFDWETWHELDVLRRELAPRITANAP